MLLKFKAKRQFQVNVIFVLGHQQWQERRIVLLELLHACEVLTTPRKWNNGIKLKLHIQNSNNTQKRSI